MRLSRTRATPLEGTKPLALQCMHSWTHGRSRCSYKVCGRCRSSLVPPRPALQVTPCPPAWKAWPVEATEAPVDP